MHVIVAGEFMVDTIFYNPTIFKKVDNAIRCFIFKLNILQTLTAVIIE